MKKTTRDVTYFNRDGSVYTYTRKEHRQLIQTCYFVLRQLRTLPADPNKRTHNMLELYTALQEAVEKGGEKT